MFSAQQSSNMYYFNIFSMTRPGREPDTSSTEYGDAGTELYPWVLLYIEQNIFVSVQVRVLAQ